MTSKRFALSPLCHALMLVALLPESHAYASANFDISVKAGTTLPTTVSNGQAVSAFYTITNKTRTARNGYSIVGLPSTVTQITTAGDCPIIINLNAYASCTLELRISGEVHSNFAICKQASCTTGPSPLDVTLQNTNLVAAGNYNSNALSYPLLANSLNGGTWTYSITSDPATLPSDFVSSAGFASASCSGSICIGAGTYQGISNQYPLLALSNNNGLTWSYPSTIISNLPSDYLGEGRFTSASCNGNTCIAAGEDDNSSALTFFLAQSNDQGNTWTYPIGGPGTLPPDNGIIGNFNSVSCSSQDCIAAGFYVSNNSVTYPILAQSPSGQTNWTYPISRAGQLPPDFFANGEFIATSCYANICIVGGSYSNTTNQYPSLALSTNGGVAWNYPIYSGGVLPQDYVNGGFFNAASCYGRTCIAGGYYYNSDHEYPMLAQSTNGGASWTYPIDSTGYLPADTVTDGLFNSVSCNSTICIAAGQYADGFNIYPLLAQSIDGGATWTYPVYSGGLLPNDFVGSGQFNSASCGTENTCIAVGSYISTTTSPEVLLIETTNGGASWSYPSSILTQLPSDFVSGTFYGASVSSLVKKKMKSLTSHVRDSLKIKTQR